MGEWAMNFFSEPRYFGDALEWQKLKEIIVKYHIEINEIIRH